MYEDVKASKIIEDKGLTKAELVDANLIELATHLYNNAPLCIITVQSEKEYEFAYELMDENLPFTKVKCKWNVYTKGTTTYKSEKMNTEVVYIIGLLSRNRIIRAEEFNRRIINWVNDNLLEKCYMFLTNSVNINSEIFSSDINVNMNYVVDHDYKIISNKPYIRFNNETLVNILDYYLLYKYQIDNDIKDINEYDIASHYYLYGNIAPVPYFGNINNMYYI